MKSNLVRVDFRKNDKSEKAQNNHGFRFNQQKLFEGEVTIFQTKKSGDFWHMRMYIAEHQKYFTKSLVLRLGCLKARLLKEEENHEIFRY